MPIKSNSDLYATVEALSEKLQRAGEKERSAALHDALYISSVPGEVLGETRLQLQKLRSSTIAVQLNIGQVIDEAVEYLNKIL